jgi:hypothetical protein
MFAALQSINWRPTTLLNLNDHTLTRTLLPLLAFVAYAVIVQVTWSILLLTTATLIFAAYYAFNLVIFCAVARRSVRQPSFPILVVYLTLVSVLLQTGLSVFGLGSASGPRSVIFFQNPNQLGYYSLLSAAILVIGVRKTFLPTPAFVSGMLACIWLAQLSLSKASMAAVALLLAYGGLRNLKSGILGLLAVVAVLGLGMLDKRVELIETRFDTFGRQSDDSVAGRGYDRIWLHPEMTILGAGEGAYGRWDSYLEDAEMHSSWGTILFSYGIPGTLAMLIFLGRISFSLGSASLFPMASIFLYGLTHMGLRFVPMWILFGLIAGIYSNEMHVKRARIKSGVASQAQHPGSLFYR